MKRNFTTFALLFLFQCSFAQKIESIFFNLYTDSLKKEVFNYINIDAKLSNGKFMPLDSTHIKFTSNYGNWQGNNLLIDSTYKKDSIIVYATLKTDVSIQKSITIYFKKNTQYPILKTEKQILDGMNEKPASRKRKSQ